jgi:3-deoxy-D-manno-octulosonic-acid transferase
MNRVARFPYAAAGFVARALAAVLPEVDGKTIRAIRARRGITSRYAEWGKTARDPSRPLLWIHAPSVGEGLQALPVIERIRARHPEMQLAYTFYSPSAEAFALTVGADFQDYLPFDTASDADNVLDSLRPTALVFSKLDVWPLLVERAKRRRVRLGMLSATMPASSLRRSAIARLALGGAYSALDAVGAISDPDALRLIEAGVEADHIAVTGDTRYDQAWARAHDDSTARRDLLQPLRSSRPTMVAGSTWPSDEERLLPAWLDVRRSHLSIRLVIAPHELSAKHLGAIERWAGKNALRFARIGSAEASSTDVVIVDRYGVLGDLYALADFAYVGGGFRSAGLHSLLEPAAFGVPVVIGPRHMDNRDARLLVTAGAGFRCATSSAIAGRLIRWLDAPDSLARAGRSARDVVEAGLGAAERSAEMIESLLAHA